MFCSRQAALVGFRNFEKFIVAELWDRWDMKLFHYVCSHMRAVWSIIADEAP